MKSKIIAIVMVLFALSSCQKAFNVSSVRFSNEGGTQKIEVNTYERPGHGAEIAQKEVLCPLWTQDLNESEVILV